jgi:hypothetical protein
MNKNALKLGIRSCSESVRVLLQICDYLSITFYDYSSIRTQTSKLDVFYEPWNFACVLLGWTTFIRSVKLIANTFRKKYLSFLFQY